MARRRDAWLKAIGTGDNPLPDRWMAERQDLLTDVRFPEPPSSIKSGDLLVYYAAGKQRLFAIAVATMAGKDCTFDPVDELKRWPYRMPVQVHALMPDLRLAPTYDVLQKSPHAVTQKPHISLTDAEYERFLAAFLTRVQLQRA